MMLKINNIKKQYKDFQLHCSIEIPEGTITGFIGPNGAGKSTTIKAILNLISLDEGQVQIKGKNVTEMTPQERERIGVVLSDSGFSSYFTVLDICKIMKGMYRQFHEESFREQCRRFQLPEHKQLKEFSTGMKAKLHLLLAMSHEADLLILDEPTAGLDVIARDEMLNLLRDYMDTGNRSVLISSHISSDLENLCDDLYLIHQGRILLHEDTDVVLSDYGTLKMTEAEFRKLDKRYILKSREESFGYLCLTSQLPYYRKQFPDIVAEKGTIDDIITLMIRGEDVCRD